LNGRQQKARGKAISQFVENGSNPGMACGVISNRRRRGNFFDQPRSETKEQHPDDNGARDDGQSCLRL
jgi:hypothetical protein